MEIIYDMFAVPPNIPILIQAPPKGPLAFGNLHVDDSLQTSSNANVATRATDMMAAMMTNIITRIVDKLIR